LGVLEIKPTEYNVNRNNNMNRRQTEGRETWQRLKNWDRGQAPSERLAAHILRVEGYESIDPSHPLGGPDGLKDLVCIKNKVRFVGACYFPRGQQNFSVTRAKFSDDLKGVAKNDAAGMAFVTNQELTLSERDELVKKESSIKIDLFHLEKIASILDFPQCYGIRLEYLDIEMTKEEQIAFMATFNQFNNRLEEVLSHINKSDILREEWQKILDVQSKPKSPHYVTPMTAGNSMSYLLGIGDIFHKCSQCGYGYLVKGEYAVRTYLESRSFLTNIVTCPNCGNVDSLY
jgi:hypothetical protein